MSDNIFRQALSAGGSVYQHADTLLDTVGENDAVASQPEVGADDDPFIAIS